MALAVSVGKPLMPGIPEIGTYGQIHRYYYNS